MASPTVIVQRKYRWNVQNTWRYTGMMKFEANKSLQCFHYEKKELDFQIRRECASRLEVLRAVKHMARVVNETVLAMPQKNREA
ncbi:hypothetical protein T01_15763 [Trichinella spiralis]|uniref:Uncharacterized protein n=1 Tax=Trichinella spiralis TaxID=6334 RepID=A0A0V1B212_TRISP|nr:hypothetical protein T01_15763 [Trichinella spiralis]